MHRSHQVMISLLFTTAIAFSLSGCKSAAPHHNAEHRQIKDLTNAVISVFEQNPSLPGSISSQAIAENAYGGRTDQERELISGRLYEGLLQSLTERQGPGAPPHSRVPIPTGDAIREALATPFITSGASRSSFDRMLEAVKNRADREPEYGRLLETYSNLSIAACDPREGCPQEFTCIINDTEAPSWVCRNILSFNVFDRLEFFSYDRYVF